MTPSLAALLYTLGILGLFALDRERNVRISWALWLPMMWLWISGSRPVSSWLDNGHVNTQQQYLEGSPLDAAVFALILIGAIAVLLGRREKVAHLLRRNWPIVLFVSYCALSMVWSDFPGVALKRWIKSLGDYAIVLVLLTDRDPTTAVKKVLARVAFVLLPLSMLFIKYYPQLGRAYSAHWTGTQFFVGVCDTKNMLGMGCLVFGFAAVCRILQALGAKRRDRNKILLVHGTMVVLAVWLLFLSDSKTSVSCFVLTVGLVTAHSFLKIARKPAVVHFMVAVVVLSCFSTLFLGIGGGALQAMGRNSNLTGRTDIWAALLSVHTNPIIGTGFESFWLGERLAYLWTIPIVYGISEAHNGYLEVFLNLGLVGDALLAVLLWTGYKNILRLLAHDSEAGRLRLGYFVIAVVYNFTEAGIRSTDLVWIALILAIMNPPKRAARSTPEANLDAPILARARG